MKICTICKIVKSLDNFYKHNRDGHQSICKNCNRIDYRKRRNNNPAAFKARDKRYYLKHRDELINKVMDYQNKYSDKRIARDKVRSALKKGILIKELCFCGKEAEGHHHDYNKPLEVTWLCKSHHREAHGLVK